MAADRASPFRPTIAWVRLALAPALVFIVACLDRGYQTDFWQHLARGRLIAEAGHVVSEDRFTFTVPGRAMRDGNWLTQLAYYRLFRLGGLELVQVVNALALAGATAGAVALFRRAGGSTGLAAAGGVLLFLGLWQTLLVRPQSLSLGLFVALYAVLDAARRDRRWLLVPPVILALWANVHGGFAIGLLLAGAFTAAAGLRLLGAARSSTRLADLLVRRVGGRGLRWDVRSSEYPSGHGSQASRLNVRDEVTHTPWRHLGGSDDPATDRHSALSTCLCFAACLGLCVLATLLNPYGLDVYRYAADLSRLGLERGIEEWLPPGPELWVSRVFYASLVLLVGAMLVSRRRLNALDVCLIACFLPPAMIAVRMVPWWLLAVTPTVLRLAADLRLPRRAAAVDRLAPRPSFAAGLMLATIACVMVVSVPWLDRINPVMGTLRPTAGAERDVREMVERVLGDDRPRRIFARFESGNYLCWAVGARRSVFMEGHVELYPDDLWQEYMTVTTGAAGWDDLLAKYDVDTLLLDAAYHADLVARVRASAHWGEAARTGNALVFERRAVRKFVGVQQELQSGAADGR